MCGRHPGGAPTNRREATGASVCIGWDFMTWHCGRYKCMQYGSGAHSSGDGVQPGPFQQCTKHPQGTMVMSGVGGWQVQVVIVCMYELVQYNTRVWNGCEDCCGTQQFPPLFAYYPYYHWWSNMPVQWLVLEPPLGCLEWSAWLRLPKKEVGCLGCAGEGCWVPKPERVPLVESESPGTQEWLKE